MQTMQISGVPMQKYGGSHDTESQKEYGTEVISDKFEILKKRFLSVNLWESYCGKGFAAFTLCDKEGNPKDHHPQEGDLIKIDIPGPGESESQGFDWVEITDLSQQKDDLVEIFMMTCRPSKNPDKPKSSHIAHFYSIESTSTFMISKNRTHIKAAVYGRNEAPNMRATLPDRIRNILVALGGVMGVSKIQWKRLVDGLLDFK